MKTLTKILSLFAFVALVSCNNEQSLQEYYVDNQGNNNFLALDVPSSLLLSENNSMSEEQRTTIKSVKKVNLLAFPKKDANTVEYDTEKEKLNAILSDEKFQVLMRFNNNGQNARVMYVGAEDAIDEIIIFGEDPEKGFGIARVLGKDMNPQKLIELMESLDDADIDMEGVEDFAKVFSGN